MADATNFDNLLAFLSEICEEREMIAISHWLRSAGNEKIAAQLLQNYRKGLESVPRRFAIWLLSKLSIRDDKKVPGWQRNLGIDDASTVIQVMKVSEEYSGSASGQNFRTTQAGDLILPERRERLGIGVTMDINSKALKTLVAVEDEGPLYDELLQMKAEYERLEVCKVGHAQVSIPDEGAMLPETINLNHWHPGRPVAHREGSSGSLTAFVTCKQDDGGDFIGLIGSSHVLTNMTRGQKGDAIFSPAPPFVHRDLRYQVGRLYGGETLVHYRQQNDPLTVVNRIDIASAILDDDTVQYGNFVPNPDDINDLIKITKAVEEENLIEYVHTPVFKNGAGTGFTRGKLVAIDIRTFIVKMIDNRNYVFGDMMLIESQEEDDRRFSRRGDSGALVYNNFGEALGVIIGGSGRFTFAHPIDRCLKKERAKLR